MNSGTRRHRNTVALLLVAGLSVQAGSARAESEDLPALGIEEYLGRVTVGSPVLSPDGKTAAFTVGTKPEWDGERTQNIWFVPTLGGGPMQLTNSSASDWGPQWSPDGRRIAFLSSRTSPPQVFVIAVDGGEARQLTRAEQGVESFRWIDSTAVAYVSPEPREPALEQAEKEAGGGYEVGTRATTSGLWMQPVDGGGPAERITDGSFHIDAFAAAPGGDHFALVTATTSDLYTVVTSSELRLLDRTGATIRVDRPGRGLSDPEFSTDGRRYSAVAATVGLSAADGLFVYEVGGGGPINLTSDFDPTIVSTQWRDADTVTFTSLEGTACGVYAVDVDNGRVTTLIEPDLVLFSHAGPSRDETLVFVASRSTLDDRLLALRAGEPSASARTLYDPAPWIRTRRLAATEVFHYPSFDGVEISAVLTLPISPRPAAAAPLLVLPHGGPDGMSLDDFSFLPQLFAQQGFLVFEPNFRGSIGLGRDFYAANRKRIGEVDYRDIMAGVDALVAAGRADASRLAVGGWSFGGTMSNWIVGHSDRFRAAVSVAGVADYVSRYGVSDVNFGEAARWEFGRLLTEDLAFFVAASPIAHLAGATTPTLLMHGEEDRRVPVAQSYEMYRVLKELGVETKLVVYPKAGHGISDPHQLRDVLRRWMDWYESHLHLHDGAAFPGDSRPRAGR